jgi:hypothetical protein
MKLKVDQIPSETRWALATKGLTGALAAHLHLIYELAGKEKYPEIVRQIWTQIGQGSAEVVKSLDMSGDDAKSAAEAGAAISICVLGPEYAIEEMVVSPDKTIMKITQCPLWNRMKEFGISPDLLSACDLVFWDHFMKNLNPNVTMKHGKQMHRGDAYCEWIFETKK